MRVGFTALAITAMLAGTWILLPDLLNLRSATEHRLRVAARLGVIRADLWARAAASEAGVQPLGQSPEPLVARRPLGDAARALRLSPLLASQWLILAEISPLTSREPALTMAFFTGPGDRGEVPNRLRLAAQSLALDRPDLCDLLRPDINFASKQSTLFLAELVSGASPANRTCLQRLGALPAPGPPTP